MPLDIRTLLLPEHADEPGEVGDRFREAVDVVERVRANRFGAAAALTAQERLAAWTPGESEGKVIRYLLDGDRVCATASNWFPLLESTSVLDFSLAIGPDTAPARRREMADALTDDSLRLAGDLGRTTLMGTSPARAEGSPTAATGFGGVDADDPSAAALIERGFTLEQVHRFSVADVRDIDLEARLSAARARTGPSYETLTWEGETPEEHRLGIRRLHEQISTDAPVGGLELEAETWSEERLTEYERSKMAGGRTVCTVAMKHRSSGELVGYTQLVVGAALLPGGDNVARQNDTLVAREHRGHAIGMLMKLANFQQLAQNHPTHQRVSTLNAEENRHMLAVNEAADFVAVAHEGVWQKRVRP